MAKIERTLELKGQSAEEIYKKISGGLETILKQVPAKDVNLQRDDEKKTVSFDSPMASAKLQCFDGRVQFELTLGLMASMFKGKVTKAIDDWLAKALPDSTKKS